MFKPSATIVTTPVLLLKPVHLLLETRPGSEVLDVSIGGIGKVVIFVPRMDTDVVDRVELPAEMIVEHG